MPNDNYCQTLRLMKPFSPLQNRLFKFFCLHVDAEIAKARKSGTFVEAIGQMGRDYESVEIVEGPTVRAPSFCCSC